MNRHWLNRLRSPFVFFWATLLLGSLYIAVVPPWQAPDEPGHYEYARLWAQEGHFPQQPNLPLQRRIIAALDQHHFWQWTGQSHPDPLPSRFAQNPFLRRSAEQVGDEKPLYYLPLAYAYRLLPAHTPPTRELYVGRVYSLWLYAFLLLTTAMVAYKLWPKEPLLRYGLPAALLLSPMPLFIGSSLNSDNLANLAGTLFFAVAFLSLRRLRRWQWLALPLLLLLAWLSKRTTLFLWPTALSLPFFWLNEKKQCYAALYGITLVGFLLVATTWLFSPQAEWATSWWQDSRAEPAQRVTGAGLHGSHGFQLTDADPLRRHHIAQPLPAPRVRQLRGKTVLFSGWVRAAQGSGVVCFSVTDNVGRSDHCFRPKPNWQEVHVRHSVAPNATTVRVVIGVGAHGQPTAVGKLWADNLRLTIAGSQENVLTNGNCERPARRGSRFLPILSTWLKVPLSYPDQLFNPASYRWPALRRYTLYTLLTFAGFWGNFGWLQRPLPVIWYPLLLGVNLVALWGAWRRWHRLAAGWERNLLAFATLAVLMATLQTLLPMIGQPWQPQGRYIFPALLPIYALLTSGIAELSEEKGAIVWRIALGLLIVLAGNAFILLFTSYHV